MNKDIFNNFSYIIENRKSKSILVFLIVLSISFILFIIIMFKYKYHDYNNYFGYVKKFEDKFYVLIYLEEEMISSLDDSILLINGDEYDFEIIQINYYNLNNKLYYETLIDINLAEEWKIDNNIINIILKSKEKTLIKEIKDVIF